ncbi:PREDICTED: fatty acid amide hydrolase-like, partial [Amphimedon queenslandica]|uniref:Amidase domain-containing protein n=1 Tax=Amphimedon queenslandica TaxID=400682 RepID=A0AAN0II17_AMPQE
MVFTSLIAVGLIFLSLFFYVTSRRPVCTGKRAGKVREPVEQLLDPANKPNIKYELKGLSAPILTGYPFRWLVRLGGFTRLGNIVIPHLKRNSNLDLLDGEYIPETPTLYPPVSPPVRDKEIEQSNIKVLEGIARKYVSTNERISSLDYWAAYKSGSIEPVDVARVVLECVRASNSRSPPLRAFIETNDELTMKMAEESTERWKKGKPLSLLDGVPIAIKGEYKFDSFSFRAGATFKSVCSDIKESSVIAKRLVEAGAIMIGITNMQEFGIGVFGSNPHKEYLSARNPYDDKCYCGGSSSGSAAAVASGLCPIALGGDGGGSVRIPSSLCGVTGLK